MNHTSTHPRPEKLQIKFHHQGSNPGDDRDVKKTVINNQSEYANLQHDFRIKEETRDLQREFEIEYEQFLTNIRGTL
jgi:hypothetical protein